MKFRKFFFITLYFFVAKNSVVYGESNSILHAEFINCQDRCPRTEIYERLFDANSFAINSFIKIDSLFYATITEIAKLPLHGWIDNDNFEWLDAKPKDCKEITIPKSLFSFLNKAEQDSAHSYVKKNNILSILDITDTLFKEPGTLSPPIDIIACSIYASIEQEPNGEYTLLLNNASYEMARLSNNHYVLRKK